LSGSITCCPGHSLSTDRDPGCLSSDASVDPLKVALGLLELSLYADPFGSRCGPPWLFSKQDFGIFDPLPQAVHGDRMGGPAPSERLVWVLMREGTERVIDRVDRFELGSPYGTAGELLDPSLDQDSLKASLRAGWLGFGGGGALRHRFTLLAVTLQGRDRLLLRATDARQLLGGR